MGLDGVPAEALSGKNTRLGPDFGFTGISRFLRRTISTVATISKGTAHTATGAAISTTLSEVSGSSVPCLRWQGTSSEKQPRGREHHRHPTTLTHCLVKTECMW